MTHVFHALDDAVVILCSKGVYRQAKVYSWGPHLFASYGSGFIRLYQKGTSLPNVRVETLHIGVEVEADEFGRLSIK